MLPRKTRHILYAVVLVFISIFCSTVLAKTEVSSIWDGLVSTISKSKAEAVSSVVKVDNSTTSTATFSSANSSMFMTIIQGANEEAVCPNDGSTLAKFFLCGVSDIRTLTLSQSGSSYQWQQLDPNTCAPTVVDDCPTINTACTWNTVGTNATYDLSTAGEFRVRVDSGQFFYFKSTLNPLDPQLISEDIICGNPGRVEVTNVPAGYEYSLNSSAGPYQDDPFFDIATPGDYRVWVRLKGVSASACLFPSNTETIQNLDITVDVTANDILCPSELGSIDVQVSGVPGFYTYRLIKDGVTINTFGPNVSDSHTFANVSPGTYEIRVETNDCSETVTTDTSGNTIEIGGGISPLAVSATASESFGCGATSIDVNLTTSGGTAPYRFSVDAGPFSATYTGSTLFTVNTPATYAILVEDANGCQRSASVDVPNIPPPIFNLTEEDANCGGANNGRITVNVTNGFGYEIEYSNDNGATFQTSNVFSNLAPGSYDIVLRYEQDSFTCDTTPITGTIGTPSSIAATATPDSVPTCLNENGGQITISGVSGGTAPYEFSIGAGFGTNPVFSNLGVGSYTPLIRDANGCVESLAPIVFNSLNKPTDLSFTISSLDCITTTATVGLSVTGGTGPYTYEIIAPSGSAVNNGTNSDFSGLGLGTYTFRVTDNEGCSYDENYAITDISSIGVVAQQTRVVTCVGDSDGEGRFLVDGFNTTYSYSIDGGAVQTAQSSGIIPITGLTAGNYVISVTDEDTNCTDTATLVIEEPAVAFAISSLDVTDMSCQNGNIGSVRVNTVGGWGGNRYTLTQPDATTRGPKNGRVFSNLSQDGTYQVSVTDANGCTVTDSFTLTELEAPTLTLDLGASDFCYDNFTAATLVVNATLGTAPYQYRINGGPLGASSTFAGLTPGTYTIEVVDANDCRDTVTATIEPQVTALATTIQELDCAGPPGQIRVNISNGYTTSGDYDIYEVQINGGGYTSNNNNITGNSFIYNVPNDGSITTDTTFQFLITDSRGCTTESNIVTISPPETIAGSAVGSDTQCGDNTSGIVELIPDTTQGVPPYEYSNDGGATFSSQNIFSGYGPGTHGGFVIRDSRGCISPIYTATIGNSSALEATTTPTDAVCTSGTVNGSVAVAITGGSGVAPFDYVLLDVNGTPIASSIGTPSLTANFPNLPLGNYTVVTTDSQGCEDRDEFIIDQNELNLTPLDSAPLLCSDTSFPYRVRASGGTAPYEFRLVGEPTFNPADNAPSPGDVYDFSGQVVPGVNYFVEVRDANGCTYIEEIGPIGPANPVAVAATATSASCDVSGTGSITYEVNGIPSGNFTVTLENTDTGATISGPTTRTGESMPFSDSFTGLPPGNYQIIVTDDLGCSGSTLVFIGFSSPSIIIDNNVAATCNAGAFVTVRGFGGTAPFTYAFVPTGDPAPSTFASETTFEIAGPYPGDYDFYVQDANGCTALTTATVTQDAGVPTPTIDVTNQCTAVSGYQIEVTAPLSTGSGLPEETFEYNIGSGYQTSVNFVVPNPGSYIITVRDGNGCTNTVTADVFDFFAISANATSFPTCNAGDGEIVVNTTGGSGNFRYQLRDDATLTDIGPPQSSNIFTSVFPGDYNILVTDLDSNTSPLCSDEAVVNVSTVNTPVITATPSTNITCNGADNGTISVELQPGTDTDTPLSYILYDGASSTVIAGPQGSPVFDNLTPNTYQVEVVSDRGCTDRSANIIISEPTALMVNTINTEFSCNPSSNQFSTATITIFTDTNGDGSGTATGTGPYTYSMNDGTAQFDGTNFQTSNTFEVVDNGTNQSIILTVRDQNGCEETETITINAPTDITFTYAVGEITCDASGSGVSPGSITIIVDQGPGNYQVEILPLGSEAPRSSSGTDRVVWPISTPGDYIFAVTDIGSGGCSYLTTTVNVPEYNTIEPIIAEVSPVSCFGASDGEISLEVNNYTGQYNYEVFSRDNSGVETTTGVTGSFDTNAPINSPEIITGVPAGNLVVRIEALDTPFCDAISNVTTVRSPDRPLTVTTLQTADVTCNVPGLGEITATGDGGWGTYQYQLIAPDGVTVLVDYPNTNPVFENLSAGLGYTINIRDIEGCETSTTQDLLLPDPITADIRIVQGLACNNDNDGIIEAFNETGGQGPGNYLYQLNRITDGTNSGLQTTPTFANLSAGDYRITIFDGWNCEGQTALITIQDPDIIVAELVELQPPGCGDIGRMELRVTNPEVGVDYFYRREGTSGSFIPFGTGMTSIEITADITVDPGPFQYEVQNSNGCPFERSNEIRLDPAAPLVISLDLTNATINCAGEATGIIRSEAFGGIGSYMYTLVNNDLGSVANGGVPNAPIASDIVRNRQASGIFRNLGPGTYYVYADSGGCETISTPIVITSPPPLVLDYLEAVPVACAGDTNGQIIIEASGGTGQIRYSISDTLSEFFEGDDPSNPNRKAFNDLSPRTYDVIIQDDLGCTITRTVEITQPMELVAAVASTTPEICLGEGNGTLTLSVSGGTAPYYTSVNSADDADFTLDSTFFFDNLIGGETYVIFVRDANGCQTNVIADIGLGIELMAEPIVEYGCDGIFPNSTATVSIADGSLLSNLLFSLDENDVSLATEQRTFGDLPAGEHTVYIYHQNGCVTFVEFEVEEYEPLTLEAVKSAENEVTAIATGGFGGYEYFFQGESTGEVNVFTVLQDANINIMVRDQNGCVANLVMPFDFDSMPEIPNFFTPDGDNLNDFWRLGNSELFPNLEVKIYDRYGRVVAILNQVKGWDGTYEGNELPTGDYWYVVNANDEDKQQFVGHFTLYR
ncbi:T9SS type B sorting domain-containing protein [Flagellimonas sp. HMM57]|uniref:T9SS type B sorting domain-containing protein n=1 Tax=unclassified Flagellimonas TaxID=2644544 RepID=UPI0013D8C4E8|nr:MULTISPECIES: T9SS type B sorting domain-containing protein [unclassified Flagellimonas]UII75311.1 T9SS type B sorting domain-containing protein [Flagellimonas sp. HMM57]